MGQGGGYYMIDSSNIVINNNSLNENKAKLYGGGIYSENVDNI